LKTRSSSDSLNSSLAQSTDKDIELQSGVKIWGKSTRQKKC